MECNKQRHLNARKIVNSIHNDNRDSNDEPASCEVESEQWSENDEAVQKPAGNFDTVMQPADFREFNRILSVAPAEGNSPLGMFQDINAEFLSFPTIYCGESRQNNNSRITPIHYSTICKWELRNADRRVAYNVTNIFFKLKKLQIKQISDKVSLAVRKGKLNGKKLTVDDVLTEGSVNNIVKHNEGYRVLRTLRGSPPYWEKTKKDIYSMIHQLGIPTWFCSFSAAETKWKVLLCVLGKLVKNKTYSDSEIDNMAWSEKNELIKSDPVTCARYFDFRLQMFFNNVLKHESAPVGKIKDVFFRIEFQQRGSPHVHILLWIDGAPKLGQNSEEEIGSFIDKHVTCKKNPTIPNLVNYQTHRHARTCRKKGKSICRFGFPMPPLDKTLILEGLDENESEQISAAQKNYENILASLNNYKPGDNSDVSFKDFLLSMKLSYKDYIMACQLEKDFFSNQVDDPVVTELQHENERDANEGSCQSQDFGCFNPGNTSETREYDLALDMNIGRKQISNDEHLTGELNDDEYRDLVQKLNIKQKEFFYHVLHWMKTKDDPIYHFLSGGAGVGKSVLLKALYQALTKFFSHKAGENPDEVKVIICAPTGKAAFNVGGSTIHSVFNIPAEQGFNYRPLDMQQLGTF